MNISRQSTAPGNRVSSHTETSPQNRESQIVLEAITRQFYPDLKSDMLLNEDIVNLGYLYKPLMNNINRLPRNEKQFVETINELKRQFKSEASLNTMSESKIDQYLNDIFKAKNRNELEMRINNSELTLD